MPRSPTDDSLRHVEEIRRFNRFYTGQIGLLHEGLLESPFSLTEVRVLYELAHRTLPTASAIGKVLGLDPGYLSRILKNFQRRGYVSRLPSESDARQSLLRLTKRGHAVFDPLDRRANTEISALIAKLPESDQRRLAGAMRTIESLLRPSPEPRVPYLLRSHEPGDMGWVVYRHGALYAQEYGYNQEFEALVATIVADFLRNSDPKRERCWIAERDGEIVGSVFLVKKSNRVAQLRLLLVEPTARGLGIGRQLVSETVRFAREKGYRRIILWTQSELAAARHLYQEAGFHITHRKRHHTIKKNLVAETWELKL
jgi:DNA-binding MarR family transcriptional regulator/GNAT superfamily N-acetyltransferase